MARFVNACFEREFQMLVSVNKVPDLGWAYFRGQCGFGGGNEAEKGFERRVEQRMEEALIHSCEGCC